MKKLAIMTIVVLLIAAFVPLLSVGAAEKGTKGASERAYERASEEAIFHRVGDWFATRGKSEEEKEAIIAERKATRAAKRAQKEAEKQKRKMEKEGRKTQKKMKKKMKGFRK